MKTKLVTEYSYWGQITGIFGLHFKVQCILAVLFCGISTVSIAQTSLQTGSSNQTSITITHEEIEALVDSLSIQQLKAEVLFELRKKGLSTDLFTHYLDSKVQEDRIEFFKLINQGKINFSTINSYRSDKKQAYINSYNDFLLVKNQLISQLNNNSVLAVNGPCTNIDFENGTTSGWQTSNADACRNATPCNAYFTGASRIQVTNKSMTDPYIPGLSVVNPASGNRSVRMEDYVNGGNATMMRQTFLVSATNNVFSYHYAAVLEDPQENHNDNERPYFKVRMYDASGKEIKCASYEAIAKPPINNFKHVSVPNPNRGMNGGAQTLELYYRDWSTVSIPLLDYVGQNVTIEFSVSDCSRGAHLGYVYIDAECFELNPATPNPICGNQTVTITASPGFASYQWTGPGIVGASTNQSVKVNKPGDYSVKFTPFADNPCPVSLNVKVIEHCNPNPITTALCEDKSGTLTVNELNLNNYTNLITSYHTPPGTVVSWHKGLPATAGNKVTTPTKVVVKNGDKFYAVINYSVPGGDTAEIKFTILPKPVAQLQPIATVCAGISPIQLTGASPAGGTFSGSYVTSSGLFTPSTAGTFKIKYTVSNASGCIDSATQNITVIPKPVVNAGQDQTICSNALSISLSGSSANASSVAWTGSGSFSASTNVISDYVPSASELNSSSFTLTLTAKGMAPCASVSDQVIITVQPAPIVDAGPAQTLCSTNPVFHLTGTSSTSANGKWTGGTGVYSNNNNPITTYTASQEEINSGTVTLNYSVASSNTACPGGSDDIVLTIIKAPTIEAGPSQKLCENVTSLQLTATSTNSPGNDWSGGLGSFASSTSLSTTYTPTQAEVSSGSITLTVTAKGNSPCAAVDDKVTINFVPVAKVSAGIAQKLCTDNKTITLTGTAANYTDIKWSGGAGIYSSSDQLQSSYIPTEEEKTTGLITFTLTANANAPCPAVSNSTTVEFVPAPVVDAGQAIVTCVNQPKVSLSGSVSGATSYTWSSSGSGIFDTPNNSLQTNYTLSASELVHGTKITLTAFAPLCLPVSDEVTIKTLPLPQPELGPDKTLCEGTSLTISTEIKPGDSYSWVKDNTTLPDAANSISVVATYGTTKYFIEVTDKNNCQNTDSIIVKGLPKPVVSVNDTSTCKGVITTLQGVISNYQDLIPYNPVISWQRNGANLSNTTLQLSAMDAGVYTFSVNASNCIASDKATLTVHPLPTVTLPSAFTYCSEKEAGVSVDGGQGVHYLWEPGFDTSKVVTISTPGIHKLTVTNQFNCSATASTLIRDICPPRLFIGDAFSPDRDGINDHYNVYGDHIGKFHMLIFNRWGEIIFESNDRLQPWDGYYKDELIPIGVYPWTIIYEGDSEEYRGPYKMEGSVTVIR